MLSYPWLSEIQKYVLIIVFVACLVLPYFGAWGGVGWVIDIAIIIIGIVGNITALRKKRREKSEKDKKRIAAKKAADERAEKRDGKKDKLVNAYREKKTGIDPSKTEKDLVADAKYFIAQKFSDKVLDSMDDEELIRVLNGFLENP